MTTKLFYMTTKGAPIKLHGCPIRTEHNIAVWAETMEMIVNDLGHDEHDIVVNIIDELGRIVGSSK